MMNNEGWDEVQFDSKKIYFGKMNDLIPVYKGQKITTIDSFHNLFIPFMKD